VAAAAPRSPSGIEAVFAVVHLLTSLSLVSVFVLTARLSASWPRQCQWARLSAFAGLVGPFLGVPVLLAIIFIGFFNLTTLLLGLFYASNDRKPGSLLAWRGFPSGAVVDSDSGATNSSTSSGLSFESRRVGYS
jgi:hypothetical protein